jgi:phytoene dehydrogenase-like protein
MTTDSSENLLARARALASSVERSRALLFKITAPDWVKRGTWTPEQAALLLTGIDPKAAQHADEVETAIADHIRDLALSFPDMRAEQTPAAWVSWAKRMELPIPPCLDVVSKSLKPANKASETQGTNTLMKMVYGMAVAKYGFDPVNKGRTDVVKRIVSDLEIHGVELHAETVRVWLKKAADA